MRSDSRLASPSISLKVTDEQPSGGTPSLANGSEKVAPSEATMSSISVAVVTEAPTASRAPQAGLVGGACSEGSAYSEGSEGGECGECSGCGVGMGAMIAV